MKIKGLTIVLALLVTGCTSTSQTPEQQAALKANIERNRVDPADAIMVSVDGSPMRVLINKSRTVALVTGVPGKTSIAMMEQAVERETKCQASAPINLTETLKVERVEPLSDDHYRSFGGTIPIRISC